MTFQAAVGDGAGLQAPPAATPSRWSGPLRSGSTCTGIWSSLIGVVGQQRQRELAALAGPQDARRPAGGHGQDLRRLA